MEIKGPSGRLQYRVERLWRCPVCQQERSTGGDIVHLLCECGPLHRPPKEHWMQLIEEPSQHSPKPIKADAKDTFAEIDIPETEPKEPEPETTTAESKPSKPEEVRLVPDHEFPPYSYVSGQFPHPESDPAGHSFGKKKVLCDPLDAEDWPDCHHYLVGLDLFNHGYYWEAHESWENLWRAVDRKCEVAQFLQGLIKLAAAAVKSRERIAKGVQSHARRARDLFQQVAKENTSRSFMGLILDELIQFADSLEKDPILGEAPKGTPVELVFTFLLIPQEEE